ncbi:MAG TPA: pyridoxal phosphate-dependent aminotransferase [Gemmatimonadaceae bacterium]|nr:pyridoxal phosphate-dependent aminotransferase [Gemmatimonadaceae bacterium]
MPASPSPDLATATSARADEFAPSANLAQLQESATIAVSIRAAELRAQGRDVIDLGAGQPDFDTPAFIRRAAAEAVEAGATRYTHTAGILPLREAIAADATALSDGRLRYAADDVVVSSGSKQSLFNACFALFGPGDEALVPVPGWTSYVEMVRLARAEPVLVEGDPARGYKLDPARLAAAATPRTRGLVLNSPCNPTGAVYDADELRALLALATERDWWVISDEIYRLITYEQPAPSALAVAEDASRLVVVNGVAKAYAMTGWRIGWAVGPTALARTMTALQSHTTYNAAAVSQHAALAVFAQPDEAARAVHEMVSAFRERRDAALALLTAEAPALRVIPPAGAFYLYLDVSHGAPGEDDPGTAVARRLLDEADVAVVPGAAFGTPGWIRLSYAAPLPRVVEGVRRVAALVRS